jgi:SAM-dependent methyltransferase
MTLRFTAEAEKVIDAYVEAVKSKIDELGFEMSDKRRRDFLLSVKHSMRLSSIRHAKKRRVKVVEERDAKKAIGHVSPARLIRHGLQSPETFLHVETLRKKHFQIIKEKLASSAEPRVLDAGCQYGRQLMEYLRHGLKSEFFGVDIDKEAIGYGKAEEPSIEFINANVEGTLPFKNDSFDAVICIGVLHLTRERGFRKTIGEFARVLKPDGLIFFMEGFAKSRLISGVVQLIWRVIPQVGQFHHKAYLERILRQNGFTNIRMDKAFSIPLTMTDVYLCTGFLTKS